MATWNGNDWNDLLAGVTNAAAIYGSKVVAESDKDEARQIYKQSSNHIANLYNKYNENQVLKQKVDSNNADPNTSRQGIAPQEIANPQDEAFSTFMNSALQLSENPQGKPYADALGIMYDNVQPKYSVKEGKQGEFYRYDEKSGTMTQLTKGIPEPKFKTIAGVVPFAYQEGEDYYLNITGLDENNQLVIQKKKLTKEEFLTYEGQQVNRGLDFTEKEDIKNQNKIQLKLDLGALGLLGSKSGKGGKVGTDGTEQGLIDDMNNMISIAKKEKLGLELSDAEKQKKARIMEMNDLTEKTYKEFVEKYEKSGDTKERKREFEKITAEAKIQADDQIKQVENKITGIVSSFKAGEMSPVEMLQSLQKLEQVLQSKDVSKSILTALRDYIAALSKGGVPAIMLLTPDNVDDFIKGSRENYEKRRLK